MNGDFGRAALVLALIGLAGPVFAHAVAEGDKGCIQEITGVNLLPFIYRGVRNSGGRRSPR